MKFGQILTTQRNKDWRCISYDMLKRLIKDGRDIDFYKQLELEIVEVDAFFRQQQAIFESNTPEGDGSISAADLRSHAVLNYLAVLKILKKHDKKLQRKQLVDYDRIAQLCTSTKELLFEAAFCIAINDSALFNCTNEMMGCVRHANECSDTSSSDSSCPVCLDPILAGAALPCKHQFCWSCLATCAAQGINSCPMCRKQQSLEPANIEIERILGGPAERYYPENQTHSRKTPISHSSDEAALDCLDEESKCSNSPVSTPPSKCRIVDDQPSTPLAKIRLSNTTPPPLLKAPMCPLFTALQSGSAARVQEALQEPFAAQYPFFASKYGPALCCALRFGCSEDIIDLLLQHGADIHAKDARGLSSLDLLRCASPKTALTCLGISDSAKFQRVQQRYRIGVAKLLVGAGADPDAIGFDIDAMAAEFESVHFDHHVAREFESLHFRNH